MFVDLQKPDVNIHPQSPAFQIGFKPFDTTQAGVYGPIEWVQKALSIPVKPLQIAPPLKKRDI